MLPKQWFLKGSSVSQDSASQARVALKAVVNRASLKNCHPERSARWSGERSESNGNLLLFYLSIFKRR